MPAEIYLARRYLLNHRPGAWGWMIGWLATGSVALGVMALIITLAVMTGFREDIRQKILGIQPHVLLSAFAGEMPADDPKLAAKLNSNHDVTAWSPYVTGQVLIGKGSQSSGAVLKGVDPAREPYVANLKNKLVQGDWSALTPVPAPGEAVPGGAPPKPRIFLGQELARNVGARLGDTVWIVTPGSIGLTILSIPKVHTFTVAGLIESGLYDYDASLAYVDISSAQDLFGMKGTISGVGLRLKDPDTAERLSRDIQKNLDGAYWVRSWLSLNHNLFSALKLEKAVMFLILILVTLVASVMIVSNLLLNITQKVREIGILRAMGATGTTIRRVFLLQGALMGIMGTLIGSALGVVISIILGRTNLIRLPADVYYIDKLPVRIETGDVASVIVAACLIVLIATLYPAHRATQIDPLDAIRYG